MPMSDTSSLFSEYIVFADESGDHGLERMDPGYPIFVLIFCVFRKRDYCFEMVPALGNFKFKHFGHDQVILHEREIRKSQGYFKKFRDLPFKKRFIEELSTIIGICEFKILGCVIDKSALYKSASRPQNPYHLALDFCLRSLRTFVINEGEQDARLHIIAQRRGRAEDNDLASEFAQIMHRLQIGDLSLNFDLILADKKTISAGLEIADLVARPIGRRYVQPSQENRAFEIIQHKLIRRSSHQLHGDELSSSGRYIDQL